MELVRKATKALMHDNSIPNIDEWISKEYTYTFKNVNYTINQKNGKNRKIIDDVSGMLKPGALTAFMGPSGAGKTTMLNVIGGRTQVTKNIVSEGTFLINGKPFKKSFFKKISSYVLQDDVMVGSLTVRENILYSAHFRLSSDLSIKDKKRKVDEMIQIFGLTKCADSYIGTPFLRGVSGGERRRASIAIELVTKPSIIVLDEPTSGLDAASAHSVLTFLKRLSRRANTTIVMTIHQPSSELFTLIDHVYLLAGGKLFFAGPRASLIPHFDSLGYPCPEYTNPADFVLFLVNTDFIEKKETSDEYTTVLVEGYVKSELRENLIKDIDSIEPDNATQETTKIIANSLFHQIWYLTKRAILVAGRDISMYWARLAMYILMAILMGTTWFRLENKQKGVQDRLSAYFFGVAFLCCMAIAGIPGFIEERLLFLREHASGAYKPSAYVISTFLVATPFIFFISLCFTAVAYPLMNLREGADQFFSFLLYLYLALFVAESLASAVSAIVPFFVGSLTITAFLNGFFLCLQGYFVRKPNIPIYWIWGHYFSYHKYSFEAMIKKGFDGAIFDCNDACFCFYPPKNLTCQFEGRTVLEELEYQDVNTTNCCLILGGMIIFYRFVFYLALKYSVKKSH
eukprot:c15728_g1_i2.p1 GENE.c15728_g1_i2~~c15728_g1_i2.p1  ORF type:complete len:628 (-),score=145.66 c15728_g1_i2:74-1957(-)